MRYLSIAAALMLGLGATAGMAAEVSVKGVHLCCGACVNDVLKTLKEVPGVSGAGADQNTKVVNFKAEDDKTATAALAALAKAGFHGSASVDKKDVAFPSTTVEKGTKADSVTVSGVHLCCGACVTGAQKALKEVANVEKINIDRNAKTINVTGKEIDVQAFLDALYKGGYHGELKKDTKK